MRYGVDVLNASKNKVAELSGMVKARLREKVNDMALLTVETIEKKEWEYIIAGTSFFRLRNILAESYNTFRVKEVKKLRIKKQRASKPHCNRSSYPGRYRRRSVLRRSELC